MATIVNTPSQDNSGIGTILGMIFLIFIVFLVFYYGVPAIGRMTGGQQINIPSKIDVNINQPK